jgi:hypothetical protein
MTASPPPPGPWGAQPGPHGYGQPAHGQPPSGPPPPGYPPQGPPPPWYPPPLPPNKGSGAKWLILAALVAVVAVAAAVIVVVLHSNSGANSNGPTNAASDIASANDKGPVTVITQDPSCSAWESIDKTFASSVDNGWLQRDATVPATAWTAEQRGQYAAVGQVMRSAADQTVALAKLTPHRVMRELYEQFIAYGRAYSDHISNYVPSDEYLARVANATSNALGGICDSIAFDAAAKRGPLVPLPAAPSQTAPPRDPAKPQRFLPDANPICGDWVSSWKQFDDETESFRGQDLTTAAAQWTPEQKAISQTVAPKYIAQADKTEQLGKNSHNPVLQDFATLSAQYYRAFVLSIPSYGTADSYLLSTGTSAGATVRAACEAVGG